ncbi:MAG: Poly-beta-hydroxybutyrate polymerase, partial [Pseudomonadota bacterium]
MTNSTNEFWSRAGEEFQQNLAKSWGQAMQTFQTMDLGGIVPGTDKAATPLSFSQDKLKNLQATYLEEATALWNHGLASKHELKDRRFSSDAWTGNPMAAFTAGAYLLNAKTLMGLADAVDADEHTQNKIKFAVEQWVAA